MADTDASTLAVLFECNSRLTPGERIAQVFALNQFNRAVQEAMIRQQDPDEDDLMVLRLLALRRWNQELVEKVFGPLPSVEDERQVDQ